MSKLAGSYANICANKLRKRKLCTSVSILRTNPWVTRNNNFTVINLDVPTNDSMEIVKVAKGLENIYKNNYTYKKAGVIVGKTVLRKQNN